MNWQPIETAPKGKLLILYHPEEKGRNALSEYINVNYYPTHYPRKPTHWMALPPAPESEAA